MAPRVPPAFVALVCGAVLVPLLPRLRDGLSERVDPFDGESERWNRYMELVDATVERLRSGADEVAGRAGGLRDRLAAHPMAASGGLAALFLGIVAAKLADRLEPGTWPSLDDSLIFEYVGWYVSRGNRLYIDVWEVKPPLSFEITAVLALVAGDDVVLFHLLNVAANCTAVVLGAAAAAGIVHELTDDPVSAVVAGAATFTMPVYAYRALVGFKAKYFVVAAGLWCLYLAYRGRHRWAGVAGAAALGFWQLALVFPLGALGLCWRSDGRDGAGQFVVGGLAAGGVVLLPVVLWGAVPAMVTEVFLVPLLAGEGDTVTGRVQLATRLLGRTLPVAVVGAAGLVGGVVGGRLDREWPLVLAAVWFTLQITVVDLDTYPDLFPWLAVLSVGVGLAVAPGRRWRLSGTSDGSDSGSGPGDESDRGDASPRGSPSWSLGAAILALALVSVATMGGYGTGTTELAGRDTFDTSTDIEPQLGGATTYNATERQALYWNRVEIPTCRALGAHTQFTLVTETGLAEDRVWYEAPCGQFDPTWRAVRQKYGF